MSKFLSYPVSPVSVNQPFGVNPEYYARFKDRYGNPEKGHMGVDFMAYHGQPLYAPCDGDAKWIEDAHGGEGIWLDTLDGKYRVIMWHLCSKNDPQYKPLISTNTYVRVTKGQHIAYTDNSGAPFESSGDHLHFGLIPLDGSDAAYPGNGFNGCVDPMPFFSGETAIPTPKQPVATSVPFDQAVKNLQAAHLPGPIYALALWILKRKYGV